MKTTVDLPDDLLHEAKAVAAAHNTTLRSLLVEGLRWVLVERMRRRGFRLRDDSVPGNGLQPGVTPGAWEFIRDAIYPKPGS